MKKYVIALNCDKASMASFEATEVSPHRLKIEDKKDLIGFMYLGEYMYTINHFIFDTEKEAIDALYNLIEERINELNGIRVGLENQIYTVVTKMNEVVLNEVEREKVSD